MAVVTAAYLQCVHTCILGDISIVHVSRGGRAAVIPQQLSLPAAAAPLTCSGRGRHVGNLLHASTGTTAVVQEASAAAACGHGVPWPLGGSALSQSTTFNATAAVSSTNLVGVPPPPPLHWRRVPPTDWHERASRCHGASIVEPRLQ